MFVTSGQTIINGNINYKITQNAATGTYNSWGFDVRGTGDVTVNGKLTIDSKLTPPTASASPYLLIGTGNSKINITGGVYIAAEMQGPNAKMNGVQANGIYAQTNSQINITGPEATIISVARKPDAVTAKYAGNSAVIIDTVKTNILGSMDFIAGQGQNDAAKGLNHTIKATFDGSDSWWYGDEFNVLGNLDVTFKNGAEWIYFGQEADKTVVPIKRITAITLENGGAINMFDNYVHQLWQDNGIAALNPEMMDIKHDYVRIGDLRGTGGIFRLDMNGQNKANSDMIFVENSTTGGQHQIQAYSEDNFNGVSANNTLRFATVAATAKDKISFVDSKNIYNESLYDYNLLIGSSDYDVNDPENATYNDKVVLRTGTAPADANDINTQYTGGKNWFIYGVERSQSAGSIGITSSADASFDMLAQLDTLNKRLGEARYLDENNGVWVRMQRGHKGREDSYGGSYTMGQIGYDKLNASGDRRTGIAIDYTTGNTDFEGFVGVNEQTRRSAMLYNTWTGEKGHYLDLVLRYSRLNSDANVYNQNGQQYNGDFDTWGLALSGEYGYKKTLADNWFVEPQSQLQITHLGSSDYTFGTKMKAELDSANSIIGRIGFRLGREVSPKSMYYMKADLLHEFGNGQDVNMSDGYNKVTHRAGENSTWYSMGIGIDHQISNKTHIALDLEKSFGGHVDDTWQVNAGVRWEF